MDLKNNLLKTLSGEESDVVPVISVTQVGVVEAMTVFPKVVEKLQENGLEVPAIGCGGGAVRKDFVESFPMSVYGVEAYHTPKLADAILKDKKTCNEVKVPNCLDYQHD